MEMSDRDNGEYNTAPLIKDSQNYSAVSFTDNRLLETDHKASLAPPTAAPLCTALQDKQDDSESSADDEEFFDAQENAKEYNPDEYVRVKQEGAPAGSRQKLLAVVNVMLLNAGMNFAFYGTVTIAEVCCYDRLATCVLVGP